MQSALTSVKLRKVDPSQIHVVQEFSSEDDQPYEVFDGLYIGSIKCAENIAALKEHGITHILTVCTERSPKSHQDILYKVCGMVDSVDEDLVEKLQICLPFIDQVRAEKKRVLVHCLHGVSRSGSVVIAYIMKETRQPFLPVWQNVKQIRRVVHPNDHFKEQLQTWFQSLNVQ